ncbi:MAG: hypothetical protein OEN02_01770 [Gammaproteobacteria bacterium]|nr:hypothetical protein [Gammaproteobacteria bacterium]
MLRLPQWLIVTGTILVGSTALAANGNLEPTLETHTGPWYQPGAPFVKSLWEPGQPASACS